MNSTKELNSLYFLHNYRQVYKDIQSGYLKDEEIKSAKKFLDLIKSTAQKVLTADRVPNLKDDAIQDEKQLRSLYYDTLQYSFIDPQKRSSEEIIEILVDKYKVQLNASKLSKLKQKSVMAFASGLDL